MNSIFSNMNIATIENYISDQLQACELWADLKLSKDEYRILTEKIKETLNLNSGAREFVKLMDKYPLSCVTQMVFYIVFNYQDEFWTPWTESLDLDIDVTQTSMVGRRVNTIIQDQGFTYDDDGYKYITPLTCQAGIPNEHLSGLFDVVDTENQQVLDPFSLINELLGWKSYLIHKPVMRYIKTYRDKSISLLIDINEIIHSGLYGSLNTGEYDDRLITAYDKWRTEQDENRRTRKKAQQEYPFPTLAFSNEGKGLCLRLPSIISKNEYASDITWAIIPDNVEDGDIEIKCKYYRDAEKLYSKETLISVIPANRYEIKLYDDINSDKPLKEQIVNGFGTDSYLLFDGRGHRILDEFLPNKEGFLMLCNDESTAKFLNINTQIVQLPKRELCCRAWYIAPESAKAVITISTNNAETVIPARSMLDAELIDAEYLFGDEPVDGNMPVYTSLPKVAMQFTDITNIADYSVSIHHRQTGFRVTENAGACLTDSNNLDLSTLISKTNIPYGIYDIRIYEKSSFRKALGFAFVPAVKYSDDYMTAWPTKYSNIEKTGFDFVCPDQIQIEITGDVAQSFYILNGEEWTSVRVDTPVSLLYGSLTFNCGGISTEIPWAKKVRYLEWSFWNESKIESEKCFEMRILEDNEIKNYKYWLSMWINPTKINKAPRLELRSKAGTVLQQFEVQLGKRGKWTLPLDSFSTTLESVKLPVDMMLCFEENDNEHIVALARLTETVILPGLRYINDEHSKNRPMLIWKAEYPLPETSIAIRGITEPDYMLNPSLKNITKSKNQQNYYLLLSEELPPGVFKIEPLIDDDFFIEEIGYRPPLLQGQNIFSVATSELNNQLGTISGILKMLFAVSTKPEVIDKLTQIFTRNMERIKVDITESVCKLLVCLICNFAVEEDDLSRLIMKLVDNINVELLNERHRTLITKWILGFSLSAAQTQLCFKRLNLFLSADDFDSMINEDDIRKIGDINPELELLWMLRTDKIKGLYQKLCSLVGLDALKEMLTFTPLPACGNAYWHDCFEKTLSGKCHCSKVSISKGICGRSEDLTEMFEWGVGYKLPYLDLEKRPNNGIYFCGQTYIDLLISWYLSYSRNGANPGDAADHVQRLYPRLDSLKSTLLKADNDIASEYLKKMNGREVKTKIGCYPLFYYTAIAALGSAFVSHGKISSKEYEPAQRFLIETMDIFPELVKRDLLLCELIMFFERGK